MVRDDLRTNEQPNRRTHVRLCRSASCMRAARSGQHAGRSCAWHRGGQYSTRDGSSQPADGRRQPASRWQEGRRAAALGELQPCQQMLGNAWPCESSSQPMDRHLSWRGGEQRRQGGRITTAQGGSSWPWKDRPARSCLSQAKRAEACGSAVDRASRSSGRHRQVTRKRAALKRCQCQLKFRQ